MVEGGGPLAMPPEINPDVAASSRYLWSMLRDYWNLSASPFDGGFEPATFYPAEPQQEALARLEWLLTERQRFALVTGAAGSGKSHLAAMAVRRLGGLGAEATLFSVGGLPAGHWADLLLDRLPLEPAARQESIRPWQKIEDHLRENTLLERTTALVLDDLHRAPRDCLEGIERLVAAAEPRFSRILIVATTTGLEEIPPALRQRSALRIDLRPWHEADVTGFLAAAIRRAGGKSDTFSADAAATITRFARGCPRTVGRLAHLALAAAAGDRLRQVDAATVERAWRELEPAGMAVTPSAESDSAAAEDFSAAYPAVRAVRRLAE